MPDRRFPHLLPPDVKVWIKFLDHNPDLFDYYEYDVRVGTGRDPGDRFIPNIRKMGVDLSQRRIDAVGHKDGIETVIEITHSLGLKAIGQIVAYPILYVETFNPEKMPHVLIVAGSMQSDVAGPLAAMEIPVILTDELPDLSQDKPPPAS